MMKNSFVVRPLILAIVLGAFLIVPHEALAQCAMCRAVLESEGNADAAEGINDGIVYLMAIPYVLIAGIGIVIYRKMRTPAVSTSE
ncbi:MAG: hypothetical protein HN860_03550 [Flavobacteriaceae bacterium]|nr:hypothetical protein [Flavobacteriaceae bacterium]